eukprot:TRINITY_DN14970_c0_g1_i1.p1 TRINITY_DN14970_c0_g1~~TRINITY_DN14970_c0_g1_i1.p1  ORF type:complete len:697 (-),score=166.71 TRINITY_DN14970_c0_g1_i1:144-2234(-)
MTRRGSVASAESALDLPKKSVRISSAFAEALAKAEADSEGSDDRGLTPSKSLALTAGEREIQRKRDALGIKFVKPSESPRNGMNFVVETQRQIRAQDLDERRAERLKAVSSVVDSWNFVGFMTALTVINIATIGIEVDVTDSFAKGMVASVNATFLLAYICELCFRFMSGGANAYKDRFLQLDFFIILIACLEQPFFGTITSRGLPTLRLLRVLKMARYHELFTAEKELHLAIHMTFVLIKVVFWACLVVFSSLWACAIFASFVIGDSPMWKGSMNPKGDHEPFHQFDREQYFGTVLRAWLTLMQVTTLTEWANHVVRPVTVVYPTMIAFFYLLIFALSFGIILAIPPVFVNVALNNKAMQEKIAELKLREKREAISEEVMDLIARIDEDNDGNLSETEMERALESEDIKERLFNMGCPTWLDAHDMICMIDRSGDGLISYEEFRDRMVEMQDALRSRDWVKVNISLDMLVRRVGILIRRFDKLVDEVNVVKEIFLGNVKAINDWAKVRDEAAMYREARWQARYGVPTLPDPPKEYVDLLRKMNRPPTPSFAPQALLSLQNMLPLHDRGRVAEIERARKERDRRRADRKRYGPGPRIPGAVDSDNSVEDSDEDWSPHEKPRRRRLLGRPPKAAPPLYDEDGRRIQNVKEQTDAHRFQQMILGRGEEVALKREVEGMLKETKHGRKRTQSHAGLDQA